MADGIVQRLLSSSRANGEDLRSLTNARLPRYEANAFASDVLIPPQKLALSVGTRKFDKKSVLIFANDLGIAPGIIVGKLQRQKLIASNQLNDLKRNVVRTAK